MKRITFFMMTAVALAGCQDTIVLSEKTDIFEAIAEGFDSNTKTSIDNQKNILWSENDQLAIFQGSSVADKYQVTAETTGTGNGTFELVADNSGEINDDFNSGVEIATNIALYPYAEGLSVSNTNITDGNDVGAYEITGFVLPEIQHYVPNSFGEGTFPMVAVTGSMSDHTLKFKNLMGAIKLRLKGNQTVKSIQIVGNNNEKLSGSATIKIYPNGYFPAITMSGEASTSVFLDCAEGVQLSENTIVDFIIILPPVLFNDGFTVTIIDSEDQIYTVKTEKANTILRSSILVMPVLNLNESGFGTQDGSDDAIYVKSLFLNISSLVMYPSISYAFEVDVIPTEVTYPTLTWSSSNTSVAQVDRMGNVIAIADGTAIITVTAVGGVSATCTVVVKSATAVATEDYIDEYNVNHGKGTVIGETVWAPVNCGYKSPTYDGDNNVIDMGYPYGKLYQWGRKYGQGYGSTDASYPQGDYNIIEGPVMPSVGLSEDNKEVFVSVYGDWCSITDAVVWNEGTDSVPVKGENDPCPKGWRVPTSIELSKLSKNSSWNIQNEGRYFTGEYTCFENMSQIFFPAAGNRDYNGFPPYGDYRRDGTSGHYWSSMPGVSLYFFSYYVGMYGDRYSAYGQSVRCVQE